MTPSVRPILGSRRSRRPLQGEWIHRVPPPLRCVREHIPIAHARTPRTSSSPLRTADLHVLPAHEEPVQRPGLLDDAACAAARLWDDAWGIGPGVGSMPQAAPRWSAAEWIEWEASWAAWKAAPWPEDNCKTPLFTASCYHPLSSQCCADPLLLCHLGTPLVGDQLPGVTPLGSPSRVPSPLICPVARFTGRADEGKAKVDFTHCRKQDQVSCSHGPSETVGSSSASRRGRSPAAAAPLGSLERARSATAAWHSRPSRSPSRPSKTTWV